MIVLALDAAGAGCSVCLWQDGDVLAAASDDSPHGQAEALVPMIRQVMAVGAGEDWRLVDRLAVTVGPGSFTGLRVGLATARGLQLACGAPLAGVTTFAVRAAECRQLAPACSWGLVAIDARRDDLYLQLWRDGQSVGEPCALPVAAVADWLDSQGVSGPGWLGGDAALMLAPALENVSGSCWSLSSLHSTGPLEAFRVAALAAGQPLPLAAAEPLYIRPPDAVVPRNGGQLRPPEPCGLAGDRS